MEVLENKINALHSSLVLDTCGCLAAAPPLSPVLRVVVVAPVAELGQAVAGEDHLGHVVGVQRVLEGAEEHSGTRSKYYLFA